MDDRQFNVNRVTKNYHYTSVLQYNSWYNDAGYHKNVASWLWTDLFIQEANFHIICLNNHVFFNACIGFPIFIDKRAFIFLH